MLVLVLVAIVVELLKIILALMVAARSEAWGCSRSLIGVAGSNPAGVMDAYCERCVLPGGGHCGRPIGRLGESCRV